MLLALSFALLFAVGPDPAPPAPQNTFHLERDASRARGLVVEVDGGDVRIRAHRSGQLVLDAARSMGASSCKATLQANKDQTLSVQVRDPAGKPCVIDVQLKVPANLPVTVRNGSGNVFVSGLRDKLKLDLAQGNAVVGGTFSQFSAHLAEGSLSVQGIAGTADIDVAHGNVQLYVAGELAQSKAHITLQVARGNATLISPFKAARIEVATPAGHTQSSLDAAGPDAKLEVTGELAQGNMVARYGH